MLLKGFSPCQKQEELTQVNEGDNPKSIMKEHFCKYAHLSDMGCYLAEPWESHLTIIILSQDEIIQNTWVKLSARTFSG